MKEVSNWVTLVLLILALFLLYSYFYVGQEIQFLLCAIFLLVVCSYRLVKKFVK
ncbi:hypothetical protein IGJ02_000159 [Enterococcus sp. DIV0724b]